MAAPPPTPPNRQGNFNPRPAPPGAVPRGSHAGLPRRPKADRLRHLTPRQILELLNAEAFAEWQGIGFTAHATLHWRCNPAFDPSTWGRRLTRFLDKLRRWLKRQDIPVAFAWVNEVGREYGEHTHLVLHVPKPRRGAIGAFNAFKASLHAWIMETEGFNPAQVDRFGKPWPAVKITGARYGIHNRRMRSGLCKYLLKGIDPKDLAYTGYGAEPRAASLGIRPRRNAAPILNQRFGASRSLGPAARRAAGWVELRSLEELHARLNPA